MRLPLSSKWTCLVAIIVTGCGRAPVAVPELSEADFGRFEGEVVAAWDADGRNMTLREDFAYVDSQGRRWLAPTGSEVNGATIPRLFWTVIGGPFEGKYRNASVLHDVGCVEMQQSWEDVHRMFYEACRCGGVDEAQAKVMYYAVYHFGPRWQRIVENVIKHVTDASGQVVEQEVAVQHVVRIDPPPPTPDEVEQVKEYVADDNPEPAAIERFNRDSLRRRPWRGRPDKSSRAEGNGTPAGNQRDLAPRQDRPEGAQSSNRNLPDQPVADQPGRRPSAPGGKAKVSAVGQEEQQWATDIVRQHLEQQAGGPRPAEYRVERSRDGYRVLVEFLHQDDRGEMVPYAGGTCTARVSRDGRVQEVVSGDVAPTEGQGS
jgi:hypothetical protein